MWQRPYLIYDLATHLHGLVTKNKDIATFLLARSFLVCVRSFLQHVLATKNVGNIIFIGGKVMIKCGKDIMIGVKWMKSPYPTLSNAYVTVCCLYTPQPCLALSFLSSNVSMLHFDRRIHSPPILSCLVVVLGMRVFRSFVEKYNMAA